MPNRSQIGVRNCMGLLRTLVRVSACAAVGGQVQRTFAVAPPQSERQLIHAEIALPTPTPDAKPEAPHRLSLRVSAASAAHHHLGVIAELRR